jgi:hypothetical protein
VTTAWPPRDSRPRVLKNTATEASNEAPDAAWAAQTRELGSNAATRWRGWTPWANGHAGGGPDEAETACRARTLDRLRKKLSA